MIFPNTSLAACHARAARGEGRDRNDPLLARDCQLLRVQGPQGRREFIFSKVSTEVITSYYGGNDQVSARALLDALRNLRGLLAQEIR